MRKQKAGLCALVAAFIFCAGGAAYAALFLPPKEGPTGEKHRPVVVAIAAQNEIGDGEEWKIYMRASDPDGDLDKVYVTFTQPGGEITNSMLPQKKTGNLNGYILVWARLEGNNRNTSTVDAELEISVEDRAGNTSEAKKLEFVVGDFKKKDKFSPPADFNAKNKLGQAEFGLLTEDENIGDNRL